MIDRPKEERLPDLDKSKLGSGWTNLHSWVFLGIIALGFLILGIQNRYHYLSPAGLGKAYRIDKVFGGIQEFEPSKGWITAQLQSGAPPSAMSMLEPSASGPQLPQVAPMNMSADVASTMGKDPETSSVGAIVPKEERPASSAPRETLGYPASSAPATVNAVKPVEAEMTVEQRLSFFQKTFPDFGEDEFQLANDDLFPDWKKRLAPTGTWADFLLVYKDFIRWWNDAGNPAESGIKLWQEYLAARGKS
jgi:hypothetical protein